MCVPEDNDKIKTGRTATVYVSFFLSSYKTRMEFVVAVTACVLIVFLNVFHKLIFKAHNGIKF